MGAEPVAFSMFSHSSAKNKELTVFSVRKTPKEHGLRRLIEGPSVTDKQVLVVEGVSTTGASALKAVEAVEAAGGLVVGVAAIIDRGGSSLFSEKGI